MNKCDCWHKEERIVGWCGFSPLTKTVYECYGTKEREECQCMGDRGKCDFYQEVREKAEKENGISELKPRLMTADEAISALEMCQALMLFDPMTGETHEPCEENKDNQDLYNACSLAISALRRAQHANEPLMLEQMQGLLERLEAECREAGAGREDYTNGYRWGHRNGQIELLRRILNVREGACESDLRRKPEGSENE